MYFSKKEAKQKATKIKAILFDIDGVMTDGGIIYDNNRMEYKKFNVKDGQIVSHLKKLGFVVGAITGRKSSVVENRCRELKLDFHRHGIENKLVEYEAFKIAYNLTDDEICYIGDDIIDLSILTRCGLSATPLDSFGYIKARVDLITEKNGGEGVFREVADYILSSQDLLDELIKKQIGDINE